MTIEKLKDLINWLSQSQWFYWRLKEQLNMQDKWQELLNLCIENNIKDWVDFVMFILLI